MCEYVCLNASISKTKQLWYGFLFIFRCIASKYICTPKIKKQIHRKGQLRTSGFKSHMLSHTEEKQYAYELCQTSEISVYTARLLVHTEEKSYT